MIVSISIITISQHLFYLCRAHVYGQVCFVSSGSFVS
jgi:hypothetical protein